MNAEMKQTEGGRSEQISGGKFLSFQLFGEEYAVEVLRVREIIGIIDITPVPQTPDFVKGVINLRGKVIPVIDLRLRFGLKETSYTEETCIIVVDVKNVLMGVIIDTVLEVLDIKSDDIDPAPSFGVKVRTDYIYGMCKTGKKAKILLDIERVLSAEELHMVEELSGSAGN
ncbi:MAG: chemotaxis protein CheW [Deltaproteobacteria bacterium]|nr:chemotaxis protein CheW [Deltaproteobacteria bacterium]